MPIYNFTIRAQETEGAFADQDFSIFLDIDPPVQFALVDQSAVYVSSDGAAWTRIPNAGGRRVLHGGGRWMVSGAATGLPKTSLRHSANGRQWSTRAVQGLLAQGTPEDPFFAFVAGRWWVHGAVSETHYGWLTTTDLGADTWQPGPLTGLIADGKFATGLAGDENVLVATYRGDPKPHISRDKGASFVPASAMPGGASTELRGICRIGRRWFVGAGAAISTSDDLLSWKAALLPAIPASLAVSHFAYSNGRILASFDKEIADTGSLGICLSSDDLGDSWVTRSFEPFISDSVSLCSTKAVSAHGIWCVASSAASTVSMNGLRISQDGSNWSRVTVSDSETNTFSSIARVSF